MIGEKDKRCEQGKGKKNVIKEMRIKAQNNIMSMGECRREMQNNRCTWIVLFYPYIQNILINPASEEYAISSKISLIIFLASAFSK